MLQAIIASVIILVIIGVAFEMDKFWKSLACFCFVPVVVYGCTTNPSFQRTMAEDAKAEAAAYKAKITPRPLSFTPDGCTVYVFTTDRDHYFTRCGGTVSTETNWTESCGKNCRKQKSDTITTEGNK